MESRSTWACHGLMDKWSFPPCRGSDCGESEKKENFFSLIPYTLLLLGIRERYIIDLTVTHSATNIMSQLNVIREIKVPKKIQVEKKTTNDIFYVVLQTAVF